MNQVNSGAPAGFGGDDGQERYCGYWLQFGVCSYQGRCGNQHEVPSVQKLLEIGFSEVPERLYEHFGLSPSGTALGTLFPTILLGVPAPTEVAGSGPIIVANTVTNSTERHRRKVYCTFWLNTSQCRYESDLAGCRYLHKVPSVQTLRDLGVARVPRWLFAHYGLDRKGGARGTRFPLIEAGVPAPSEVAGFVPITTTGNDKKPRPKTYCRHWLKHNACRYALEPAGCRHLHEIPTTQTLFQQGFDWVPRRLHEHYGLDDRGRAYGTLFPMLVGGELAPNERATGVSHGNETAPQTDVPGSTNTAAQESVNTATGNGDDTSDSASDLDDAPAPQVPNVAPDLTATNSQHDPGNSANDKHDSDTHLEEVLPETHRQLEALGSPVADPVTTAEVKATAPAIANTSTETTPAVASPSAETNNTPYVIPRERREAVGQFVSAIIGYHWTVPDSVPDGSEDTKAEQQ
ncbi:hypothetical protein EJ06DRAFT_554162 [Trichodelitschia bisporula]|uniref:C3H1-type domain-containing protein n=1 Tax=Trichodelitschia bisporula TaxID=703511 RepID=A0A6G1I6M2_9PEZI|nr:hypothetical protein EJ06DRAFT_554162 [Trichodelitschia bisporula]